MPWSLTSTACMAEGFSEFDDEKVPCTAGTAFHVQGPQTKHRRINTGKVQSQQLRIGA